ncbi:tyrosine-type recombinase/integrase [Rossellomorea marisflavi]|uniref:tyrosine-type recombinase/integrase n=1 Tax=Rossellomorea marisflavi TaxID=189381 RepID=UPI0009A77910|nr:site-specific integrase [Rossellomorea marisflavi]
MVKRKASLHVKTDLSNIFNNDTSPVFTSPVTAGPSVRTLGKALETVLSQMEAQGMRPRTIDDYNMHVCHFMKIVGDKELDTVTVDDIYEWLSSMDVSNQTKLTRLKCLKAFLGRCFDNGYLRMNFWRSVRIRVDSPVKEGATDREIQVLLSMLDLSKFVELRDATAVLLMYQTGIRVGTLTRLQKKHIDLEEGMLRMDGGILKNHQSLHIPFDDVLKQLLTVLTEQNDMIREEYGTNNELVFVTKQGTAIATSPTNNNIIKRLGKYARTYGLKNINPHALRRGFAKKLLEKGADIALISKALGHGDLAVTTRYLHLDQEEVADSLRKFL